MIKLIFLGTGSAFTVGDENYQSNILIEVNNSKLLVDCGSDARHSLCEISYSYQDITDVYISHLHADHVGGLEWLAFTTYFDPDCKEKVRLHIAKCLVSDLWKHVLSGGLCSLQGMQPLLNSYFSVKPISGDFFEWENIKFYLIETHHSFCGTNKQPSFGLFFEISGKSIFFTTDTKYDPKNLMPYYQKADIIFQDCETGSLVSGIHARFDELVNLPSEIKQKMWLYHYNNGSLPNAIEQGFLGFVKKGQSFEF